MTDPADAIGHGSGTGHAAQRGEPRRRLHPLSPVLHSAKSLVVIIAAISWQGYAQLGLGPWFGLVTLLLVGAVGLSVLSWFMTGYHVIGRELRVYEGVLWRRTRAIPLERLQSVEVVRPLLAQLTGLAELRLEVVGGAKTEAPLAFLAVKDAAELRDRLLILAGRLTAPRAYPGAAVPEGAAPGTVYPPSGSVYPPSGSVGATGEVAVPGVPGVPTLAGDTAAPARAGWPMGAGLPAAPPAFPGTPGVPGVSAGVLPFPPAARPPARSVHMVENRDVVIGQLLTPHLWSVPFVLAFIVAQAVMAASWSFIAIASTLTAMAGIVLQPARRVLEDWDFRLARDQAGLRVKHGLLETRSQTVPVDRVQLLRATWPLLWRPKGWLRMRLEVAGMSVGTEQQKAGPMDNLLPVGDLETARRLVTEVLPTVDLAALSVTAPPRRARWLVPVAQPRIGAVLTEGVFAVRSGVLTRRLALVPYARIQSVRLVQGPVQRLLGLATVHADTAAGNAAAEHRDLADARMIAAQLTDRARAARA